MLKKYLCGFFLFSLILASACASGEKTLQTQPTQPTQSNAGSKQAPAPTPEPSQKIVGSADKRPDWIGNPSKYPADGGIHFEEGMSDYLASELDAKSAAFDSAVKSVLKYIGVSAEYISVFKATVDEKADQVNTTVQGNSLESITAQGLISGARLSRSYWEKKASSDANGRTVGEKYKYWVLVQIPQKNIDEARERMMRSKDEKIAAQKLREALENGEKAQNLDLRLKKRISILDETINAIKGLDFSLLPGENKEAYLTKFGDKKKRREDEFARRRQTTMIVVTGGANINAANAEKISTKTMESLVARLAPAKRMLTKCGALDDCLKDAEKEDYGRLCAVRTDATVRSGALGGVTATLTIEVTMYDLVLGTSSPAIKASGQAVAWDGETILWEVALEKALKSEKLAELSSHSLKKADK